MLQRKLSSILEGSKSQENKPQEGAGEYQVIEVEVPILSGDVKEALAGKVTLDQTLKVSGVSPMDTGLEAVLPVAVGM